MHESKRKRTNHILISKSICHKLNLHRWFWTSRHRSLISGKCARCGMNGAEFWKAQKSQK